MATPAHPLPIGSSGKRNKKGNIKGARAGGGRRKQSPPPSHVAHPPPPLPSPSRGDPLPFLPPAAPAGPASPQSKSTTPPVLPPLDTGSLALEPSSSFASFADAQTPAQLATLATGTRSNTSPASPLFADANAFSAADNTTPVSSTLPLRAVPAPAQPTFPQPSGSAPEERESVRDDIELHHTKRDSFFSSGDSARNSFFSTAGEVSVHLKNLASSGSIAPLSPVSPVGLETRHSSKLDTPEPSSPVQQRRSIAQTRAEHLVKLRRMSSQDNASGTPTAAAKSILADGPLVASPVVEQQGLADALGCSAVEDMGQSDLTQDPQPSARSSMATPTAATFEANQVQTQDFSDPAPPRLQEDLPDERVDVDLWQSVLDNVDNYQSVARDQPDRLIQAIQAGIPSDLRGRVWRAMSSSHDDELLSVYKTYCTQTSEHDKAIERDLARTYPDQTYFARTSQGSTHLFDVVKAYALHDPEVGYCQGMSFVVDPILHNMADNQAFCTLNALMRSYDLRAHFLPGMPDLQRRLYQFSRVLEDRLPDLYVHLIKEGVKTSMYAPPWFMSLFCYRVPLAVAYRVLDTVFLRGIDALFDFAHALLRANEQLLLTLSFDDAVLHLKHKMFDVYRLPDTPAINSSDGPTTPVSIEDEPERSIPTHERYAANTFLRDATLASIPVTDLERYATEWDEELERTKAPEWELEALKQSTWALAARVRDMESDAESQAETHQELMKQVVNATLDKDEVAEQLIRYKTLYAEAALAQAQAFLAPPPPPPPPSTPSTPTSPCNSPALMTRSSTSASGATRSTASSDRSTTVAQSVSATVASWGRWMSRATPKLASAPVTKPDDQPNGDISHAESIAASESASDSGYPSTPPPLPPRTRPVPPVPNLAGLPPLPPHKSPPVTPPALFPQSALVVVPDELTEEAEGTLDVPELPPRSAPTLIAVDSLAFPSEAQEETTEAHAEDVSFDDTLEDAQSTPNASPLLSPKHKGNQTSSMESVTLPPSV